MIKSGTTNRLLESICVGLLFVFDLSDRSAPSLLRTLEKTDGKRHTPRHLASRGHPATIPPRVRRTYRYSPDLRNPEQPVLSSFCSPLLSYAAYRLRGASKGRVSQPIQ